MFDSNLTHNGEQKNSNKGPKYKINIEGVIFVWGSDEITSNEIAELGGWSISEGVIMIDKNGNETSLSNNEVIKIRPGMAFSKKLTFKRG